jgi:hypothetical protein
MASPQPNNNVTSLQQRPGSSFVMVTPEMAERWLKRNKSNRVLRPAAIDQYARDMAAGKWELTGTIEFDTSGNLIQGQHRLNAVIKSGVTVTMCVLRGISQSAQRVMDSGVKRQAADNLYMVHGTKNATTVVAIARQKIASEFAVRSVSNSEIEDYVNEHPEISIAAGIAMKYYRGCDISPTVTGLAAWTIADTHGWDAAEQFFYTASEKVGLQRHDPVIAMTKFFSEAVRNRKRYPVETQLSVIIRAFNYRRAGKTCQFLRAEVNGTAVPIPAVSL